MSIGPVCCKPGSYTFPKKSIPLFTDAPPRLFMVTFVINLTNNKQINKLVLVGPTSMVVLTRLKLNNNNNYIYTIFKKNDNIMKVEIITRT